MYSKHSYVAAKKVRASQLNNYNGLKEAFGFYVRFHRWLIIFDFIVRFHRWLITFIVIRIKYPLFGIRKYIFSVLSEDDVRRKVNNFYTARIHDKEEENVIFFIFTIYTKFSKF